MSGSEKSSIAGPLANKLPDDVGFEQWDGKTTSTSEDLSLEIKCESGELDATSSQIEDAGGTVTSKYGRTIHATATAGDIRKLADLDGVRLIDETREPREHVVSEGVGVSNMDTVKSSGITGSGAKIAVIDLQFDPTNPDFGGNVVDTLGDQNRYLTGTDELHGTGCAEVVHDMAPDADLVLAALNSSGGYDLNTVLNEIESNHPDVDVATMSIGFAPTNRLDGQDDLSNRITTFTDAGRVFTVSAGNEADGNIWNGQYRDTGGESGIMEFDDQGTEYLQVDQPVGGSYIIANWDDWDEDNQAYTLRIYSDQSKTNLLDETGPTTEPYEIVQFPSSISTGYVEIEGVTPDSNQEFDLFIWGGNVSMRFSPYAESRTISIPATNNDQNTITVAAVQATDYGAEPAAEHLKLYSSQGPTRDSRQGIDIAGPSRVSQTSNGYDKLSASGATGFNGTSAAAPHIGGAAVGLFEYDHVTNADVRDAIVTTGTAIADSSVGAPPNTKIGGGYLDAAAAHDALPAADLSISANGDQASPGGQAQISVSGSYLDQITISDLWTDWSVASVQQDGASFSDDISSSGTCTFSWSSDQNSVSPSLTVDLPSEYVGGDFVVTVDASSSDDSGSDTATIQVS